MQAAHIRPPGFLRLGDSATLRIGLGHDTHQLAAGGPLTMGGVQIPHDMHLVGHSDADVLLHAVLETAQVVQQD